MNRCILCTQARVSHAGSQLLLLISFSVASSLLSPLLKKKLSELVIPDIRDTTRVKIGRIKYTISKYVAS